MPQELSQNADEGGKAFQSLPEFPVKLNLFDISKKLPFQNSIIGKQAIKNHKKDMNIKFIIKIILLSAFIFSVYYLFTNGHPIWAILSAIAGSLILFGLFSIIRPNDNILPQGKNAHCQAVVEELINNYFPGVVYFRYNTEALIYNNNICAYLSTMTGELIIYKKQNIKEVCRERIHLNNSITNFYWHFDIFTDFLEYPKVSMNLPYNEYFENEIGKAYAILEPQSMIYFQQG